ncbi:MAG: tetratricopeptide repeat-containing sulfotransferase family protein [Rhodanobacteraceae bacterium]
MSRSPEQRWRRSQEYLAQGQSAPARAQLEALQVQSPRFVGTHLLASRIAWQEDRIRDATRHAIEALHVVPDDPALLCEVVETLLLVGEVVAARDCLAHPVLRQATACEWLLRLADFRQQLNENVESLALIERATIAGATGPDVEFHHGVQLYFNGRMREAESALEASLRVVPENGRAALTLSRLRSQTQQASHLGQLDKGLARVAKGSRAHAALEFARYKELEDLERCDEAWQALATGNAVMRARNAFDADSQVAFLDRLVAALGANCLRGPSAQPDGPQPIFVIGLARSGTTVLERMLGNHPQVESAGELVDFGAQLQWAADTRDTHGDAYLARLPDLDLAELGRRYLAQTRWRAHGKPCFIDKQPPNWELAGLIHAALPQAKILHMVRDPMDVCFSNWRAFFGDTYGYSYDLAALAAYYRGYRRLMAHWHRLMPGVIMDVPYAHLVRDPEATMRKVFEHCELAWEPCCVDMQRNRVPVATLSAAQVRQPVHARAFGQWQRYAEWLAPLRDALGRP